MAAPPPVTPITCLIIDDSPPFCEAARQLLKDLILQSPNSPELNYWLGFTLLGLEKPEAAIPFI